MDISRLSSASSGHAAGGIYRAATRTASVEAGAAAGARARGPAPVEPTFKGERVVQGELLQRERGTYQSTRAYIDERGLDFRHSGDGARDAAVTGGGRAAITRYLNNAQVEALGDRARGRAVNYFV